MVSPFGLGCEYWYFYQSAYRILGRKKIRVLKDVLLFYEMKGYFFVCNIAEKEA